MIDVIITGNEPLASKLDAYVSFPRDVSIRPSGQSDLQVVGSQAREGPRRTDTVTPAAWDTKARGRYKTPVSPYITKVPGFFFPPNFNGRSPFPTCSVPSRHCKMGVQGALPLALAPSLDAVLCQPDSTSQVHFHLVHGAWHGPWTFDLLRAELEGRGYSTSVSSLPSVGTTDPEIGLYDDGAAVRADLERLVDAGKEVVLVAHSYGGLATSNGVEGLSVQQRKAAGKQGGLLSHVFVAALAFDVGGSVSSMRQDDSDPEWLATTVRKSSSWCTAAYNVTAKQGVTIGRREILLPRARESWRDFRK